MLILLLQSRSRKVRVDDMIRKRGEKWVVLDSSGKKVLGTHSSREKAVKQMQAIEASKRRNKGK
jgi:hypothetical protein